MESLVSSPSSGATAQVPTSVAVAEDALVAASVVVVGVIALVLVAEVMRGRRPAWGEVRQNVISAVMNQLGLSLGTVALTLAGLQLVFDSVGLWPHRACLTS